jgi:hypothetical protein
MAKGIQPQGVRAVGERFFSGLIVNTSTNTPSLPTATAARASWR